MAGEYDQLLAAYTQPEPTSDLPTFDPVASQTAPLRSSFMVAEQNNPDEHAKTLSLAERSGLPAPVVKQNFDQVDRLQKMEDYQFDRLMKNNPGLSQWLKNPDNATFYQDDTESLQAIDKSSSSIL